MSQAFISALVGLRTLSSLPEYNRWDCDRIPGKLKEEEQLSYTWPELRRLTAAQWAEVRGSVDIQLAYNLLTYSMRMATFALREQDRLRISDACMGLVVDPDLVDLPDVLDTAILVFDASDRIMAPLPDILTEARALATARRAVHLGQIESEFGSFFALTSSGYECITTAEGPTYRKIPIERYKSYKPASS